MTAKMSAIASLLLALGCFAAVAHAQIPTGQGNVCCAFILNTSNRWQLVCNNPTNVPGAQRFPAGTVISGVQIFGTIAQCVGRFPFPNPAPYRLPSAAQQLFSTPNGLRCAGRFNTFYQGIGADGGFVVQCTNPALARVASANAMSIAQFADPSAVAGPDDGYPVNITSTTSP